MKKILFINFSPINISSGHTFRLSFEISELSKLFEIHILTTNKGVEGKITKKKHSKVFFDSFQLDFKGWEIENINQFISYLIKIDSTEDFSLIVVNMEVWAVVRALASSLLNKKVCVVFHGVPFVGYLHNYSLDFKKDVLIKNKNTEKYKKDYNLLYYLECKKILSKIICISSNKTAQFFFKRYFKNITLFTFNKYPLLPPQKRFTHNKKIDFVYMARIEKGKGVEYLIKILKYIDEKINYTVAVAIMGKTDDVYSKNKLNQLLDEKFQNIKITYFGHADNNTKRKVLSNSKIFIYPSIYDNNPTVVYEALSYRLPVVVWNTLFTNLNYKKIKAVKRIEFDNVKKFGEHCLILLKDCRSCNKEAGYFSEKHLYDKKRIALYDFKIFNKIIKSL